MEPSQSPIQSPEPLPTISYQDFISDHQSNQSIQPTHNQSNQSTNPSHFSYDEYLEPSSWAEFKAGAVFWVSMLIILYLFSIS